MKKETVLYALIYVCSFPSHSTNSHLRNSSSDKILDKTQPDSFGIGSHRQLMFHSTHLYALRVSILFDEEWSSSSSLLLSNPALSMSFYIMLSCLPLFNPFWYMTYILFAYSNTANLSYHHVQILSCYLHIYIRASTHAISYIVAFGLAAMPSFVWICVLRWISGLDVLIRQGMYVYLEIERFYVGGWYVSICVGGMMEISYADTRFISLGWLGLGIQVGGMEERMFVDLSMW